MRRLYRKQRSQEAEANLEWMVLWIIPKRIADFGSAFPKRRESGIKIPNLLPYRRIIQSNLHENVLISVDISLVVVPFYQVDNKQGGIHPFPLSFCTILSRWIHPLSNQRRNMISAIEFIHLQYQFFVFSLVFFKWSLLPFPLPQSSVYRMQSWQVIHPTVLHWDCQFHCTPWGEHGERDESLLRTETEIKIDGMGKDVDWIRLPILYIRSSVKKVFRKHKCFVCSLKVHVDRYIVRRRYSL